jgi:predicted nucleic acid-binding protein
MVKVIDASVAAKWVLPEQGADQAAALRSSGDDLIAPDLIVVEIGNVLWKRVMRKQLSRDHAARAIEIAPKLLNRLVPLTELVDHALMLAINLQQPIYDTFYLALAVRENAAIVTDDQRLLAAARKARIKAKLL